MASLYKALINKLIIFTLFRLYKSNINKSFINSPKPCEYLSILFIINVESVTLPLSSHEECDPY